MKIAIVYDVMYPFELGGGEKRNWEVAARLVKRGHEVQLVSVQMCDPMKLFALWVPLLLAQPASADIVYSGFTHSPLGGAVLTVPAGSEALIVSNLGSSGQDGVEIDLGTTSGHAHNLYYDIPEGDGTLTFASVGTVGTQTDQPICTATREFVGTTERFGFDYSAIGALTYTLRIYNGKQLVHESPNHSGASVERNNDRFPYRKLSLIDSHFGWFEEGPEVWHPMFGWIEGPLIYHEGETTETCQEVSLMQVIDGPSVMGDLVVAIPENPSSLPGPVSRVKIQASGGISSLQIENESLTSVHCTASALGQAALTPNGANLTVSNLGSSGQDGVSLALADVAGWAVHWQPLDPADALPSGAYLQSEIFGAAADSGAAGSTGNSLLGSWRLTKVASSSYDVTADFSPLGASTVTLMVYNGTALVTTLTGQSGVLANVNGCVDDDHWGNPTPSWPDGIPRRWGGGLTFMGPTTFAFSGGASVQGDRLVILPEGGAAVSSLSENRLLTSGVLHITLDDKRVFLQYSGLLHGSLGQAGLRQKDTRLIVSNIGSSGQDGVSIPMPKMDAWDAHWQPLDPTGALPVDAYLQSEIHGTAGTISNGLLGSWKMTKADAGRYAVTADFSPLGTSTVTLMVYNGATLVTTLTGQSQSGVLANVNGCVDDDHWGNPTPDGPFGLPGRWGGALTFLDPRNFTFPGGDPGADPVQGDRLVILPEGGAAVSSLSETRLLASGIPQITLIEEHHSLQYAGLLHGSLGQTGLNVADGKLIVSNIGSSGQDGVEIKWPKPSGRRLNVFYQVPADDGTLSFTGLGSTNAQSEQEVCKTSIVSAGDEATLAFDYSSIGSPTYTLRIYNGKTLVHESFGHPSGSASVVRDGFKYKRLYGYDVHMGWYEDGPEYWDGHFWVPTTIYHEGYTCDSTPGGQSNRVIGGPTVFGDLVIGIPENPTLTVSAASRFRIQANGGISSLELNAESLTSVHSTASALGQASLVPDHNILTVGNLGSSGQDGVSLALDNVAGWAGHWQPLDPADALPAGAYLQSEIVGTAGTTANGPLGSWRLTKEGTGSYAVTADFSPLGASTVTLMVYNGAILVATLTGQSGALANVNGCVDDDHWGNPTPTWPDGLPGRWGGALTFRDPRTFAFSGSASVQGDRLVILPEGGTDVSSLSETRLLASGIPLITLDEEHVSLNYAGLLHGSLGQAGLKAENGLLTAYNLGSSGQDGVEIDLRPPSGRRLNLYYQLPLTDGTITFTGLGSTNTQIEQVVGKTSIESAGETATVAFDYSSIGSPTYTLRIYNGKTLVHESGGHPSGPCILRDGFKYKRLYGEDVHMGWYEEVYDNPEGYGVPDLIWHPGYTCDSTPGGQTNRVIGGPTVFGDLVIGIPENPILTVSAASRFQIQTSGQITKFQIGAESLSSDPASPLPYAVWAYNVAAAWGITVAELGGPQNDYDHDGYNNLLEYAFGSDPLGSSSKPVITSGISPLDVGGTTDEYLTLSCEHPADRMMPVAQASDDLQSWGPAVLVSSVPQSNGRLLDTWRYPVPKSERSRAMMRFAVAE